MDKDYWKEFYSKQRADNEPSLFAQFVVKNYSGDKTGNLIELGCGNGRDSIYFSKNDINVLAIDQVKEEVDFLNNQFSDIANLEFISGDFTKMGEGKLFDIIYSRFTLHSITSTQQNRVVNWAYRQLNTSGIFCIEVRGKKNNLYEKGEKVSNEEDAYIYENHYRRFIDFNIFCNELKNLGFTIEYSEEAKGFAPYKNTDEIFIRIIARK